MQSCKLKIEIENMPLHPFSSTDTLTVKWYANIQQGIKELQQRIQSKEEEIDKLYQTIETLQKDTTQSSYYKRNPLHIDTTTMDKLQNDLHTVTDLQKGSSKWRNHINYELFTNSDCYFWSGFNRQTIRKRQSILDFHVQNKNETLCSVGNAKQDIWD